MAIRERCLYCGKPVSSSGYCTSCGLNQQFLWKAYNTSKYYYNIGLVRARTRDLSGAIDALKMSLRYDKTNYEARNLLGLIFYEMGETVQALGHWVMSVNYQEKENDAIRYLKLLRDDPKTLEDASLLARTFNQGLDHAKQHNFDLAMIQLKKCVTLNDHFIKGYLLTALLYLKQNREGAARKCISKVLQIDRTNTTAIDYLRKMGDSEETIERITEQAVEDSAEDLFDEYYGVEETESGRPARKIQTESESGKRKSGTLVQRSKEQNLARHSNIYMVAGIIIGIITVLLLVRPGINTQYQEKLKEMQNTYNSQLSSRNSEINSLESEIDSLNKKLEQSTNKQTDLEKTIDSLNLKIEALKHQVAIGGTVGTDDPLEQEVAETSSEHADDDKADEDRDDDSTEEEKTDREEEPGEDAETESRSEQESETNSNNESTTTAPEE